MLPSAVTRGVVETQLSRASRGSLVQRMSSRAERKAHSTHLQTWSFDISQLSGNRRRDPEPMRLQKIQPGL